MVFQQFSTCFKLVANPAHMKQITTTTLLLIFSSSLLYAQDGSEFDFWVGHWDLSWQYADGTTGAGKNHILKTLDGKVIQENFEAIDNGAYKGFKGTSISVFNPNTKTWHQAWGDNQGGYFNFVGEVHDGNRIFKTSVNPQGQGALLLRMRFYNIEEDSFTWDWEQSKDGGESWNLQWRINYQRMR